MKLKKIACVTAAGMGMLAASFAPLAANAERGLYSWQGGDYSYDYQLQKRTQIHDGEDDGRVVRVEFGSGACIQTFKLKNRSGPYTDAEMALNYWPCKHRAIEEITLRPDAYGPWKYPSCGARETNRINWPGQEYAPDH